MTESMSPVSESSGFPLPTVKQAAGGAVLISTAYVAIYHFGAQLAAVVPSAVLKAAPFLPPQAWAFGITVTAVALAALYIGFTLQQSMSGRVRNNHQQDEVEEETQPTPTTTTTPTQAQVAIRDTWYLSDHEIEALFNGDQDLINLFSNIKSAGFSNNDYAGFCICLMQANVLDKWEREGGNKQGEAGKAYLNKYFIGFEIPLNRHTQRLVIRNEDLFLVQGIAMYRRIVDAMEKANCPRSAAKVKEKIKLEALEKRIRVKDDWSLVKDKGVQMKLFMGNETLAENFFEALDHREIRNNIYTPKEQCILEARTRILEQWEEKYPPITERAPTEKEYNERKEFLEEYLDDVQISTTTGEVIDYKFANRGEPLFQRGMRMYKKIIDALETANYPNIAARFKEEVHYGELLKQLMTSFVDEFDEATQRK